MAFSLTVFKKWIARQVREDKGFRCTDEEIDHALGQVVFADRPADRVSRAGFLYQTVNELVDAKGVPRATLGELMAEKTTYDRSTLPHLLLDSIATLESLESYGHKRNVKLALLTEKAENNVLADIFAFTYDWKRVFGIGGTFELDVQRSAKLSKDEKALPKKQRPDRDDLARNSKLWDLFTDLLMYLSEKRVSNNKLRSRMRGILRQMAPRYRVWAYRILMRDLRLGINVTTIQKVWPNMITQFGVSLCESFSGNYSALPERMGIEPKLDGLRLVVLVSNSKKSRGSVFARSGREQPQLRYLVDEAASGMRAAGIKSGAIDAEGISSKDKTWGSATSAVKRKDLGDEERDLIVASFDLLTFKGFDKGHDTRPFSERRKLLSDLLTNHGKLMPSFWLVPHTNLPSVKKGDRKGVRSRTAQIEKKYQQARDEGYEGVILKGHDRPWRAKRSRDMQRIKPTEFIDVIITGYYPGRKGTAIEKMLGGFVCETEGGVEIRVGGGFSHAQRTQFWATRKQMVGRVIEVERMEAAEGIKSRHTNFKRLRPTDDKVL